MSTKVDLTRIASIHEKYLELNKRRTESALAPVPQQSKLEASKFLKAYELGEVYNPQLTYSPLDNPEQLSFVQDIRAYMSGLKPDPIQLHGRVELAYWENAHGLLLQEESRINLAPSRLMTATMCEYGLPNNDLLEKARALLSKPFIVEEAPRRIRAESLVRQVQELFNRMGLKHWDVLLVGSINARFVVLAEKGKKQVKFRAGSSFASREIVPTLMRIYIHTMRPENAQRNHHFPILTEGFYRAERTSVGLYNFMEAKYLGSPEQERIRRSAARYIAAHASLSGTFYDAFRSIVEYVEKDTALDIVMRLKRGFENTAEPGCYLRDILYWDGLHRVEEHLKDNPHDELLLCSGKVGLDDLPLLKDLVEQAVIRVPPFDPETMFIGLRAICEELAGSYKGAPGTVTHGEVEDPSARSEHPDIVSSPKEEGSSSEMTETTPLDKIQIFISYRHKKPDEDILNELMDVIQGDIEKTGATFWSDKDILVGEVWDERIKAELAKSHIALVLVSDDYLHSDYIEKIEIENFISKRKVEGMVIFPLIVSVCEWKKHAWLSQTQFLPLSGKTIIGNYRNREKKKELFIEIRTQLIEHVNRKKNELSSGK